MRRLFGYDAKKEKKRDAGRGHTGRVFRGGDTEATPTAKSIVDPFKGGWMTRLWSF